MALPWLLLLLQCGARQHGIEAGEFGVEAGVFVVEASTYIPQQIEPC